MDSIKLHSTRSYIRIGQKDYRLDFDMQMMANAEAVYYTKFGMRVNIQKIFEDMFSMGTTAVMALGYGALISAGEKISWDTFSKELFTWNSLEKWNDTICEGIASMMPDPEGEGEKTEKN